MRRVLRVARTLDRAIAEHFTAFAIGVSLGAILVLLAASWIGGNG